MPLICHVGIVWLQRRLGWSNSRQAWLERAAGLAVIGAGGAAWWYGSLLPRQYQAVLWAALLVGGAVLLRRGWITLFGPVLFYDVVLTSRRRKQAILRTLYAGFLLYAMVMLYLMRLAKGDLPSDLLNGNLFAIQQLPTWFITELTNLFFFFFFFVQMLATWLLTPAYTAGAIAAEKERQTLEALLTTDLRNREIVLSVLVSRLANLALIILTGLPMLALLQFLGGLQPELVFAMFAATGLTMASLGGLGILSSVRFPKSRTAILRTYLWPLLYLIVSGAAWILLMPNLGLAGVQVPADFYDEVSIEDVVHTISIGNPIAVVLHLMSELDSGKPLDALWPEALRNYAWFHGTIAVMCIFVAVLGFRRWTLVARSSGRRARSGRQSLPRVWLALLGHRIGPWPILWKELIVDRGPRRGTVGWFLTGIVVAITLLPAIHLLFWFGRIFVGENAPGALAELLSLWVRVLSAALGTLMLLQVGIRAAGSVSSERAKKTLDSLLTAPLEWRSILLGKWLGAMFSPRWVWVWLGSIWLAALALGALAPVAVVEFIMVWLVFAGFMASFGLYCSIAGVTTQRATLWTLLGTLLIGAVVTLLAFDFKEQLGGYGLLPPIALGMIPARVLSEPAPKPSDIGTMMSVVFGVVLWGLLGLFLWYLAGLRFRILIGRRKEKHAEPRKLVSDEKEPRTLVSGIAVGAAKKVEIHQAADRPLTDVRGSASSIPLTNVRGSLTHDAHDAVAPRRRWFGRAEDGHEIRGPRDRWAWAKALRPAVILLLPLGLVIVWYSFKAMEAEADLRATIAELNSTDPGWRLEEIEARRQTVPDEQNSAPVITAVGRLLAPQAMQEVLHSQDFDNGLSLYGDQTLDITQRVLLRKRMAVLNPAVAEARRVADMPVGRFPILWARDGISTLLPHVNSVRQIGSLLATDASLRAADGDGDGALASCRAMVNAERAIGDESPLISQLTRLAVKQMTWPRIEWVLAHTVPTDAALRALQECVARDADENPLYTCLRGERANADHMARAILGETGSIQKMLDGAGSNIDGFSLLFRELKSFFTGSLTEQRAALLRFHTSLVEAARLPPDVQAAQFNALLSTAAAQPWLVRFFGSGVGTGQLRTRLQDDLAACRCVLAMLAVERFRLKYGQWPKGLRDVVPEFLDKVPIDPHTEKPLRYRGVEGGVAIFSLAAGGVDRGGVVSLLSPQQFVLRSVAAGPRPPIPNLGVRLWDVDKRKPVDSADSSK